ncbi:hypothetical protein ACGFMM_18305 [Streptomyces sp. NPDC048604]|uniref:hypothetical protein n=1 Tax=Streptomyces sp. NPDC048604 TaxID=3365578 RepID=UPI00371A85A4
MTSAPMPLTHAEGVPDWEHPRIALRWSERQHLAELELARALLADLDDPAAADPEHGGDPQERQVAADAPTRE